MSMCVLLWLSGLFIGLHATRERARWHVLALVLYAASVLLYELTLPAVLLGGVLYRVRGDRRVALRAWGSDIALAVALFALFTSDALHIISGHDTHGLNVAGTVHHAKTIMHVALALGAAAIVPFGARGHRTDAVATGIAVAGVVLAWRTKHAWVRAMLLRWLVVAAGAAVLVVAGYVMLAPASGYSPLAPGLGNRINVLAGLGYSLLVVSFAGIVATLVFSVAPNYKRSAPVLVGALITAVTVAYIHHDVTDRRTWDAASKKAEHVLAVLHHAIRRPPPRSLILVRGYDEWQAPQVPVFAKFDDLDGAVKLLWHDRSLTGEPQDVRTVSNEPMAACSTRGVELAKSRLVPYGHVFLVDIATKRVEIPVGLSSCQAAWKR